jgi:hypothetical protein
VLPAFPLEGRPLQGAQPAQELSLPESRAQRGAEPVSPPEAQPQASPQSEAQLPDEPVAPLLLSAA